MKQRRGGVVEPATEPTETAGLSPIPDWVQVEYMCPVCGKTGRTTTKWGNTYTKCPSCQTPLYNKFATDTSGVPDKAGNYYYAHDQLRPRNGGLTKEETELLNQMKEG